MAGTQAKGAHHTDAGWFCPPESLKVVTDPTSPFYDPGIEYPVPEELVESIRVRGVIMGVRVVRDGRDFAVVDGRKRHRACIEANRRRAKAGDPPHEIGYAILRTKGDADIIGVSAAANIRGKETPMQRAHKALRMVEAKAKIEQIANDLGVTRQCVDNWLKLCSCSTKVQQAVDEGLAASTALEIAELPRAEQGPALDEMRAKGALKGAAAKRAVRAKKKGQAVPSAPAVKRMRNSSEIQALLDGLQALDGEMKAETKPVVDVLRWVLRQCEPAELCDDVAAILLPEAGDAQEAAEA